MEKNMRMKFLKQRITVILLLVASVCICGSINEFYVFENDYYFKYLLNTFTGIILLTGIAYLCYPQKKTNQENELVLNEYKLVYETESTASQYFISDTEAWNTLRKQFQTTWTAQSGNSKPLKNQYPRLTRKPTALPRR